LLCMCMVTSWNIQEDKSWGTVRVTFCLVVHPLHIAEIRDWYQKLYWIRSALEHNQRNIQSLKIFLLFLIKVFLVPTKGKGARNYVCCCGLPHLKLGFLDHFW
jgi:hypothetical protein